MRPPTRPLFIDSFVRSNKLHKLCKVSTWCLDTCLLWWNPTINTIRNLPAHRAPSPPPGSHTVCPVERPQLLGEEKPRPPPVLLACVVIARPVDPDGARLSVSGLGSLLSASFSDRMSAMLSFLLALIFSLFEVVLVRGTCRALAFSSLMTLLPNWGI